MTLQYLPTLNAILNTISAVLLFMGYINIKRKRPLVHKRYMLAALVSSAIFLTSYLIYHAQVGTHYYPYHDWTRVLYLVILVPHIILAGVMTPFILILVYHALRGRFDRHKRLTRWVWPVWMYVSVSGVLVYLMLYRF